MWRNHDLTHMLELKVGFGGSAGVDKVSPTDGPEANPPLPP